jgi:hypothetical protein
MHHALAEEVEQAYSVLARLIYSWNLRFLALGFMKSRGMDETVHFCRIVLYCWMA